MKNKLSDLNDHLFMQLERLGDEDLSAEQIETEARRAEAMVSVADRVVANAALQIKAASLFVEHGEYVRPMLPMIEGKAS
jgi:hypothetical protein